MRLRCWRCNYDLDGVVSERCPECSSPVAESKLGSPWQQRPHVASWFKTAKRFLLCPSSRFIAMNPADRSSGLLPLNASLAIGSGWVSAFAGIIAHEAYEAWVMSGGSSARVYEAAAGAIGLGVFFASMYVIVLAVCVAAHIAIAWVGVAFRGRRSIAGFWPILEHATFPLAAGAMVSGSLAIAYSIFVIVFPAMSGLNRLWIDYNSLLLIAPMAVIAVSSLWSFANAFCITSALSRTP